MEFIREIPQSVQTLQIATNLFWRGVFGQLFIGAFMAWCHSEDLWGSIQAVGVAGLWMMILSTLATICLMNPLRLAPVADVMKIHAALPFLTALFALAFIRGKPHSTRSSTDMFSEKCTGTSIAVLLLLFQLRSHSVFSTECWFDVLFRCEETSPHSAFKKVA